MTTTSDDGSIVELEEGSEDEMFWAMLGDQPYARAEYWQWRRDLHPTHAPRLFRINGTKGKDAVKLVQNQLSARDLVPDGVFVLDAVFEVFVVVGRDARDKRTDIRLALYIAEVCPIRAFFRAGADFMIEYLDGGCSAAAVRARHTCSHPALARTVSGST